jgi:hypothetical protein
MTEVLARKEEIKKTSNKKMVFSHLPVAKVARRRS